MPTDELHLTEGQVEALKKFFEKNPNPLDEDGVKKRISSHLSGDGWQVEVKWGKARGIDIEATKGAARWVIEAKGYAGGDVVMQGEYFKDVLGEILQRMAVDDTKYSIAFPDVPRYRDLWDQLPNLAKRRTGISCLFVNKRGDLIDCPAT